MTAMHPPLFLPIKPTPEVEPDNEHEDSDGGDNDEYYDDGNENFEEVEPPEEETPDLISIER